MAISLGELAGKFGCDLVGDPDVSVDHVATLSSAGPGALSFLANPALKSQLSGTKAIAVVLSPADAPDSPVASLICNDPYPVFARMAAILHPPSAIDPGIHATAVVHESARVDATAQVDAHAVIDEKCVIHAGVYIGPGSYVGRNCTIGDDTRLQANVTLARQVTIGKRGNVHSGAVIGADGFGNARTAEGWIKVPQVGGVRIGDDVEIGANTTIDCGAMGDTVIENGVRLDNLCMIGHNSHVGAHTAMAAMSGLAGSSVVGQRCMFGGQSGSVGHVTICDDVLISGRGMVTKDITEPGVYASHFPAEEAGEWSRKVARLRRIETLYDRVRKLEKGMK